MQCSLIEQSQLNTKGRRDFLLALLFLGLLIKSTYGNGDYVENEYDYYDRITGVKYNGTKLFSYVYNSDGLVNRHIDNVNNKTYNYEYDMLGRLQRMDVTGERKGTVSVKVHHIQKLYF